MRLAARITNTCIRNLHAFSSYSGCSAGTYYSTTGADDAHQKEKSKHLKFMQYWMELVCVRKRRNDVEGQIVEARAEPRLRMSKLGYLPLQARPPVRNAPLDHTRAAQVINIKEKNHRPSLAPISDMIDLGCERMDAGVTKD